MIYDKKTFWKSLAVLVGIVILMKVTGGGGFALVIPIALFAFMQKQPDKVLFWIMLSAVVMMGNHFLMPKDIVFAISQRLLMFSFGLIMLLMLVSRRKSKNIASFWLLVPYLLFMIIPSALGWSPVISFMKLFLFITVYVAYIGIANEVTQQANFKMPVLRSMIYALAAFVIVGSVLLIPFPVISQLSGAEYEAALKSGMQVKSLFKGITWHSQILGPVISFLILFIFADWVLAVRKFSWLHAILLALCPILLYKTSSRTAMGSVLIGFLLITMFMIKERGIGMRWRAKVKTAVFAVIGLAVVAVVAVPSLRDSITSFALKTSENVKMSDFTVEEVMSTRQFLIDRAMYNYRRSPTIGNGFQVSDEMAYTKYRSWTQYLTAPIEKGVWVAAVLEEGGVIGMSLFVMFIIVTIVKLYHCRSYIALSLFITLIISNMGEFTFFSMSGNGGLLWGLIFVGAAFDELRLREDRIRLGMMRPMESGQW